MPKVVVDTNVLISGLLGSGPPNRILDLWRDNTFVMVTSINLINELIATLHRPKIFQRILKEDMNNLIELIEERATLVSPSINLKVSRDPHDDKLLECAIQSKSDVIVTGDADLLVLHPFRGIDILSPVKFLERFDTE